MLGVAGLVAVWWAGLPAWLSLLLTLAIAAYSVRAVDRLLRPHIERLVVTSDKLALSDGPGEVRELEVTATPFVSPLFIGLRGRVDGARASRTIGLFREQLDGQTFRRLAVKLRAAAEA